MADDGIKRIDLIEAGSGGIVSVPADQVDRFLAQGWKKVSGRGSRRADTGTIPTQRQNIQ